MTKLMAVMLVVVFAVMLMLSFSNMRKAVQNKMDKEQEVIAMLRR